MREKTDVLIIGGGPAGLTLAATGKANYSDRDFMLIRQEEQVLIPNGIPYLFGTLENSEQNIASHDDALIKQGIEIKIAEVTNINPEEKKCQTKDGTQIAFEKLVLATGSIPVIPAGIKGVDNENVFTIPKDRDYLDEMLRKIQEYESVIIIGGGSTGIEVADELGKAGKEVTIIESQSHILNSTFDKCCGEMSSKK